MPQGIGRLVVREGAGRMSAAIGCEASQADAALISSDVSFCAICAMQSGATDYLVKSELNSGAAALRAPVFHAPNCAFR